MNAHVDADPARFPPPSTMAGCLRTAWARTTNQQLGTDLLKLAVTGPLLIDGDGRVLAPAPADALYCREDGRDICLPIRPVRFREGSGADLPEGLLPVQLSREIQGKPIDGPAWWSWDDLLRFRRGEDMLMSELRQNGWSPPSGDRRLHVSIDPTTGTAASGKLFETEGLDLDMSSEAFGRCGQGVSAESETEDIPGVTNGEVSRGLRLLVRCGESMDTTMVHLGGKRRLAALEPEPEERWPTPPAEWLERIARSGGLTVTLLTPAIFSAGHRPGWLDDKLEGHPPEAPGLQLRLRAAAVQRWYYLSGWDLARCRPKSTQKLVAEGATYWFDLIGQPKADALASLWLASVCDDLQVRRDGFGLAIPGPWTPPTNHEHH